MVAQREHGNRPWLPGYCESASIYGAACESAASVRKGAAAKGSWQLGSARDCIMRCSACPQCAFVSYSREEEDCSWYTSRHAAKQVAPSSFRRRHTVRGVRSTRPPRTLPSMSLLASKTPWWRAAQWHVSLHPWEGSKKKLRKHPARRGAGRAYTTAPDPPPPPPQAEGVRTRRLSFNEEVRRTLPLACGRMQAMLWQ